MLQSYLDSPLSVRLKIHSHRPLKENNDNNYKTLEDTDEKMTFYFSVFIVI